MRGPLVVRMIPVLDFGGAESRLTLQCEMARERAYRLRVCTFHGAGRAAERIRSFGVPVDVLDVPPRVHSPLATRTAYSYLRRVRPDVLHCSISEANLHGVLAARAAGTPVRIAEEVGAPRHGRLARRVFRMVYRQATRVVGVTQAVARYLVEVDGAPSDRVRHVYNCAAPAFFPATPMTTAREPLNGRPFRFLSVGRFEPVKNHATLIRGFGALLRQGADAQLWLVGEGGLDAELRRLAEEVAPAGQIVFLGYRGDVRALLTEADAYVLPSLSEGCSISLIEAMATGLPVLGSDVDGIQEVMGDLHASRWTFPSRDAATIATVMGRMLALNPQERDRVARDGQRRAYEVFSPTAYMDRLDALYAECLGEVRR